jgi:hypothetical protein
VDWKPGALKSGSKLPHSKRLRLQKNNATLRETFLGERVFNESKGDTAMKGKKIIFGLFLGSLAAMGSTTATAYAATRPEILRDVRELRRDNREIRADKREIRRDRGELGQDLRERRLDRRELHYDLRHRPRTI